VLKLTCSNCGKEFVSGREEAEAQAEARVRFPGVELKDLCIVCDDCFQKIMAKAAEMPMQRTGASTFKLRIGDKRNDRA
jgi:DNA-directed RNA polymerase subunit RPC12/RpoP